MECETNVAVVAVWHPTTLPTLYHRRIATPVLEYYSLLASLQSLAHLAEQQWREHTHHHLAAFQILYVNHLYLRHLHSGVSCG